MLFVKKNKIFKKVFILLLLLIVSCGPSEQEIQARIDEAVDEALKEVTTTSTTTTTLYCELKTQLDGIEICLNKYDMGKLTNFIFKDSLNFSHVHGSNFLEASIEIIYSTEITQYFEGSVGLLESSFNFKHNWNSDDKNLAVSSEQYKYGINTLDSFIFKVIFDNDFVCTAKFLNNNITLEGNFLENSDLYELNNTFGSELSNLCKLINSSEDFKQMVKLEIPCPDEGCYDRLPIIKTITSEKSSYKFGEEPIWKVEFDDSFNPGSAMWGLQVFFHCDECYEYPEQYEVDFTSYGTGSMGKRVDLEFYVFLDNLKPDNFTVDKVEFVSGLPDYDYQMIARTEFYVAQEDAYCSIEYYDDGTYGPGDNNYGCKSFSGTHNIDIEPFTIEK